MFIFRDEKFTGFGQLTITDIDGSIEMSHNQLAVDRHGLVRFMLVQFCGKLSNVISSNLMQRLRRLTRLKVWWCDSLETIFDLQGSVRAGTTGEEGSSLIWFRDMKLMYLPKLMHIWKNVSQQTHYFRNLESLEVERCDNLRYLFTISTKRLLPGKKKKKKKMAMMKRGKISIFSVELENLPNLVCIGIPESQIHISKLRGRFLPQVSSVMMWKGSNIYHLLRCITNLFIEK
ncbi:unnamed protein product [Camellia sinensis]